MKLERYSPSSASTICSSWPVPSVATQSAWVSPRVNSDGPVRARQDADLGDDRPDGLGVAAVDAQAGGQDGAADHVGFQVLEGGLGLLGVQTLGLQRVHSGGLGGVDRVVAGASCP